MNGYFLGTEFWEYTETFHSKEPSSFCQVNTQAARALEKITGKKFGWNMEKWQILGKENKDKFLEN